MTRGMLTAGLKEWLCGRRNRPQGLMPIFKKVLVANRGEIAVRVIRSCRRLGIATVAVYSDADAESLHVVLADEAVPIGPPLAYLDASTIINTARRTGAQAVHPGYGFLAENADFAEACGHAGLTFIGPSPRTIRGVGDKLGAKQMLAAAGLPVLPFVAVDADTALVERKAAELGYPLMLKAAGGGGGKGIRLVWGPGELAGCFETTREKAARLFCDERLYLERYLANCRHVEFQVMADSAGRVVHLGERNCSIQRKHQKLIEEAPSPGLEPAVREAMARVAVEAARVAGYTTAGTVEFLLDEHNGFFVVEMNTRLQVEHTVTEAVTGFDLVAEQIRLAAGESLGYRQEDVSFSGWALQCRVCAEDPLTFLPSPGVVRRVHFPSGPGVRVDSHLYAGCPVPHHYDSLLAKIVFHGRNREQAIAGMQQALREVVIEGPVTNVPLHLLVLSTPVFRQARHDTAFLERLVRETRPADLPRPLRLPSPES